MTPPIWLDYSSGRPTGAQLRAAGVVGVARYVGGGSSGKRLTSSELADLTANGIIVIGVFETTTTRSNAGALAGTTDAQLTLADPVTKNLPYLCASNDQSSWSQANVDYAGAFQDVVSKDRTGVYGFGSFLNACHGAGIGSLYWQAGPAPSRTGSAGITNLWQRQGGAVAANGSDGPSTPTTLTVGGVVCDVNNQLLPIGVTMAFDQDVYNQLVGSTTDGEYPGWASLRYGTGTATDGAGTKHTVTDYIIGLDREANSRLSASARSATRADMDTVFGHAVSAHAVGEVILGVVQAIQSTIANGVPVNITLTDAQVATIASQVAQTVSSNVPAAPTADAIAQATVAAIKEVWTGA